jgi:hypothetical protein
MEMSMPVEIPTFDAPEKYEQYALNVEAHAPEKAQEVKSNGYSLTQRLGPEALHLRSRVSTTISAS